MRRFTCYRPQPPEDYLPLGLANLPGEPQFEGVEFSDGTVCIRWLTQYRSHSVWATFADVQRVHGHPEYGTVIEWTDTDGRLVQGRDQQLAIQLLAEALGLDHVTDSETRLDWAGRTARFLDRLMQPAPILRADATDDQHPEDYRA